ncbi:hypothetical protein Pfo_023330 [Paulownia fortunei]|nr:hypothetical protein Pfo_023330 [Paulownia fortunei]
MDFEKYSKELEVAVKAVHMACLLCQRVQESLLAKSNDHVQSKDDDSPVTVADWSVQATVSWVLSEAFGSENVSIVAEEDVQVLSKTNSVGLLDAVMKTVNGCLVEAPCFGLTAPAVPLSISEVLEAISRCNSTGGSSGRFWVLDPVDGTLGFVRGDQYAIALALIEEGEPVLGVLGCPNYPMKKEWLSYHNGYHRIISRLTEATSASWDKGCVIYARKGSGGAWMQPLLHKEKKFVWPNSARQIKVSTIDNPALATLCEPVEKANSSHSFTAGLAHSVGLRNQPLRVYSMVKYAAIARGDAEIFMKFARAGYKEKIWDHAAGVVIIQEAGGVVTDAGGHALCFSKGGGNNVVGESRFLGPGDGFNIPGSVPGCGKGGLGCGYGSGLRGHHGGYLKGGIIRPTFVFKDRGPCYKKKLTCPAKCFNSFAGRNVLLMAEEIS